MSMNRILLTLTLLISVAASAQRSLKATPGSKISHQPLHSQTILSSTNNNWEEKEAYVNGFARVLSNGKFSFINQANNLISPLQFEDARNFVNKLAAVKKDSKWGFINETGKIVIPFQYDIVYDFKEMVTAVFSNNKWLLIDTKGTITQSPDIDVCYGFENGKAGIIKNGRTGMMNISGKINYTGKLTEPVVRRTTAVPVSNAAVQCPDNIDFENGNFNNWNCFTGSVDSVGTTNVITVAPSPPVVSRHRIINRTLPSGIDAYGLFPTNPPDGSNFAVKLGNTRIGAEAERIQYVLRIPANDSNFSIRYDYAVVFQDPGHTAWTQPRFNAKLYDSAANSYIDCASFEYISTSSLPGFATSTVDTSVIYKPWATVYISLRGHAGQTLYLEFTTADCVRRGHWGYAYVDVENICSHSVDMNYDCGTGIASLDAPPGFQTYNWWNQDYTTILASGQNVTLNPAPPANSTIWLEMIPFNDFGCRDSMPVTITNTFTPHFDVSQRVAICAPHSFTFYNRDIPSLSATWDFGDGNFGTGDTVTHTYALPGIYTVTLTVTLPSGCNGTFQDIVTILQPSGSFDYTGGNFCGSTAINFTASMSNADSIKWDFGDGTSIITAQTNISHTYSLPGVYIPGITLISNQGCSVFLPGADTVRIEELVPGFKYNQQGACGSTTINFTDTSHSYFGITNYAWDFGDGYTGTGNTVSHTYSAAGTYTVQLIITGVTGCMDTVTQQMNVAISNLAASIDGPASECFGVPVSFTSTTQSSDPIASLEWYASNGSSGLGNAITINFAQTGTYTIQLIAETINGCRDTATHVITIKPLPDVAPQNNIVVCDGSTVSPIIFTGSMSGTSFNWTGTNPSIGLAANGTGDILSFTAVNNTTFVLIDTITVTPFLNGCAGAPAIFMIIVNPLPSVSQPADQIVCNRGLTEAVLFGSRPAAITANIYNWTNDLPSIGLATSGSGNIPAFTAINNGANPVTATITITHSNNGCQGAPVTFLVTVNPTPDVVPPASQVVCNGATTAAVTFQSSANNSVYTWTNDLPSIGLAANGADSITSFNGINNTSAPVTAHVTVNAEAFGCQGDPAFFSILVNPTPDVNQPASQSVCTGSPTTVVGFTGSVGGTTYTWTNNVPPIGLPASGTGDILSFNPNNTSNTNLVATLTVTPGANGCPGTPKTFNITIFPTPGMIQPLNQFQCNGETTGAVSFTSPVAGTTFTWTNSLPSVGLPASGAGMIPAFVTNNPTNATITAAITVTPSTNDCQGIPRTFYISVDPTPDIAQPANQTICNGETVTATAFTGTVSGTTYSWINSVGSIGLAANGTGDIPSFTATNSTHYPVTAIIQVTGSANSCGSIVKIFTITVNPSPAVDAPDDQVVCNGVATTAIHLTGPVSGTAFSWKNDRPSIGLSAIGNGDIPSFTSINNTNAPVIATILIFGTSNSCGQVLDTLTITVNPSAQVQATNNSNVCLGNSIQLQANGAVQYSWAPATGLSCANCPDPTVTPTDSIVYTVTGTSSLGCDGHDSVTLSVRRPFDMLMPPNDTICAGRSVNLNALNANTYAWSPANGLNNTSIANPTATPATTTQYQVVGYDAYHCFTDTGYVTIEVGPQPTVDIGSSQAMINGSPITFQPVIQNGPITHYSWTPASELSCSDCETPTATIHNNMMYTLTVENRYGCSAVDSIYITAFCQKSEVFVPNAFTPDGDGINDILMVRGSGISVKSFRIFNRWGEMIFERKNFPANDPRNAWDGKVRGVAAHPDVYVYTAEVVCDNGSVYTYKGNTTILK